MVSPFLEDGGIFGADVYIAVPVYSGTSFSEVENGGVSSIGKFSNGKK